MPPGKFIALEHNCRMYSFDETSPLSSSFFFKKSNRSVYISIIQCIGFDRQCPMNIVLGALFNIRSGANGMALWCFFCVKLSLYLKKHSSETPGVGVSNINR